jgi:hypothetical protein
MWDYYRSSKNKTRYEKLSHFSDNGLVLSEMKIDKSIADLSFATHPCYVKSQV